MKPVTSTDQEILNLKAKIANKKSSLKKYDFKPKTNLVLPLNGFRHNLNVITAFELLSLLSTLMNVVETMKKLNVQDTIEIDGFSIEDWVYDLKGKYSNLKYKTELKSLEVLEKRLDSLISTDMKTNMELQDIQNMLGV